MDWYLYPIIIAAGFVAGFINTLAGSGSAVTLPLLIFIGLPATVANGTNRVAILLQNIVGVSSFQRENRLDTRGAIVFAIPTVVGSVIGANIAANLNEELLETVIGVVMVVMLFVILLRPKRWLQGELTHLEGWPAWWLWLLFFGIGMYGGFIQAGVGVFLLAGLVLGAGYDLVRANAVKVAIVLIYTVFALTVFVLNDQVNWLIGLILAVGNMLGAWVATKVAVDKGAVWVRRLLIIVVIFSAARFLGIFEFFISLF